jgi:hypothetical protein
MSIVSFAVMASPPTSVFPTTFIGRRISKLDARGHGEAWTQEKGSRRFLRIASGT